MFWKITKSLLVLFLSASSVYGQVNFFECAKFPEVCNTGLNSSGAREPIASDGAEKRISELSAQNEKLQVKLQQLEQERQRLLDLDAKNRLRASELSKAIEHGEESRLKSEQDIVAERSALREQASDLEARFLAATKELEQVKKLQLQEQLPSYQRKLALVIGNERYLKAPLTNPVNDATDLSRKLQELGFEVILQTNADQEAMFRAVRHFGERLKGVEVGLAYFSGHGVEVNGRNYLIPIDADIQSEEEVKYRALDANLILDKMNSANESLNILIVDACRNNPFGRSYRSLSRGLAQMEAPAGTFISFSTAPGRTADDGSGRNSPYTKALLREINTPGIKIEDMFKRIRLAVFDETKGKQLPWESSSLMKDFSFLPKRTD